MKVIQAIGMKAGSNAIAGKVNTLKASRIDEYEQERSKETWIIVVGIHILVC
jgi:hypothetical protein